MFNTSKIGQIAVAAFAAALFSASAVGAAIGPARAAEVAPVALAAAPVSGQAQA